jgi:hypothetical protein
MQLNSYILLFMRINLASPGSLFSGCVRPFIDIRRC